MLRRWPDQIRENGHITEVASLIKGELPCLGDGQFKGGRMVMLRRWPF